MKDNIGEGSFGSVYGGICHKTNRRVAFKKLTMRGINEKTQQYYESEILLLYNMKHPGIIELLDLFYEEVFVRKNCENSKELILL